MTAASIEQAATIRCKEHPTLDTVTSWIRKYGIVVVQCSQCYAPLVTFSIRPRECGCKPAQVDLATAIELLDSATLERIG